MQKLTVQNFLRSTLRIHPAMLFASIAAALAAFAPSARADLDHWTVSETDLNIRSVNAIAGNDTAFLAVGEGGYYAASTDGINWESPKMVSVGATDGDTVPHEMIQLPTLNDVVWTGTQFVAVGQEGGIVTSPDGQDWTEQDSSTSQTLNSVAWNGSNLIAVGSSGNIVTSPDGTDWTLRSSGGMSYLQYVAATPTIAVAEGCATTWLYSTNGGTSWTAAADNPGLYVYGLVASDSAFVGFAYDSGNIVICRSTDGSHWSNVTTPFSSSNVRLNDMVWTGHEFVGVGDQEKEAFVVSSPDGLTWTVRTPADQQSLLSVGQSGNRLVAMSFSTVSLAEIAVAPSIVTPPADTVAGVGDSASFTVVAGGTGPFTYKWLKGSSPVAGGNKATLTLKKVATDDAGKYSVVVTGPGGSVTSAPATLKVVKSVVPVYILVPPAPLVANVGDKSTLSVKINAAATAPVTYRWNKGKTPMKNAAGKINGATTDTLIFKNLAKSDAGQYNVTLTNPAGSVTSVTVRVTVK